MPHFEPIRLDCGRTVRLPFPMWLFAFVLLIGIIPAMAEDQPPPSEPLVTITATNEPLGQLLDRIGAQVNYTIDVDERWQDHPVSIALDRVPLSECLKRVLVNLNYAILYESDSAIRIVIYDAGAGAPGAVLPERTYRSPSPPVHRPEPPSEQDENADEAPERDQAPDAPPEDTER